MLMAIALLFNLVSFVCSILILIHAFKAGVQQGIMCLCVPCYILYYAFTKFEHEKKNIILGVWLGAAFIAGGLQGVAGQQAASDMQQMATDPGY